MVSLVFSNFFFCRGFPSFLLHMNINSEREWPGGRCRRRCKTLNNFYFYYLGVRSG